MIIGGMGREHEKSADEFAMLVMDVLEVRREHFYPQISLRYYKEMNQDIYDRALRILGSGSTFPMLYNDDVNVPAVMRAMDVPKRQRSSIRSLAAENICWRHRVSERQIQP